MTASTETCAPATDRNKSSDPYRVMVVDDSAVIRGFLTRYLEEDPTIKVVASAANGEAALRNVVACKAEVVVLDIEMPVMDGLTALPRLLEAAPGIQVVMASTLTRKNAEISLRSLQMGAVDYVPKPETNREVNANIDFRHELVEKVKAYAAARRKAKGERQPGGRMPASAIPAPEMRTSRPAFTIVARRGAAAPAPLPERKTEKTSDKRPVILRRPSERRPEILAIGSSTGGPQALMSLFTVIPPLVSHLPVLVVQHMPATFTAILTDHLRRASGMPTVEAEDGMSLQAGHLYVARGDHHMRVAQHGGRAVLTLDQGPQENFCRPAVDPLFRSLAKVYGPSALAVILTGMGHDGLRGARELVAAGGTLIAQDEASSVVWGMPGAVATAGLCSWVVPLKEMATTLGRALGGPR